MTREQDAQRNLSQALEEAGADFTGTAWLRSDGYLVTFSKPSKVMSRSGIAAAILERRSLPLLVALIEEMRREMARA